MDTTCYLMKPIRKCILLILSLFVASIAARAGLASNIFDVKHIGYAEGLSSQRVFAIAEDGHGVIWIATKTGIDRYNGQTIKNYALPGNIHFGDMGGRRIYLHYNERYGLHAYDNTGRVYRYSIQNDRFEQELSLRDFIEGDIILTKMYIDPEGNSWFGLSAGLFKKDAEGIISPVVNGLYVNDMTAMGDSLFIGTTTGVVGLKLSSPAHDAQEVIKGYDIQSLSGDTARHELWIGTFNNGLFIRNQRTADIVHIADLHFSSFNPVRAITSYDNQSMLVGIDGKGVYVVDKDTKETDLFVNTEDRTDFFIQGNGIYAVEKDRQGNIWIGSYTGGVSMAILLKHPILTLTHERGNPHSLANNNVNDIEENGREHLWFATDNGISMLDASTHSWQHCLKGVVAVTLCRGNDGTMWVGTYGDGVYLLDDRGRTLRHLTKQQGSLTTNYILSVKQDADGDLWVGGLGGCLLVIPEDGTGRQTFDVQWSQSVEVVSRDKVAVATADGFYLVDKRTEKMEHYATAQEFQQQNVSAYIIAMLFNDDGTVWLGTEGGGLGLYDMHTRSMRSISTEDGLPSNDIYSLQQDRRGRLWVSTGKGLALIDNFKASNLNYLGDIDKEYNKSAFAGLEDGRFVYGSTCGAVVVSPDSISQIDYGAPLRFTGFTVEYLNEEEENRLQGDIYDMLSQGNITLDYWHNSFVATFESINYRYQSDITYQYILEGYDKHWSSVSANGMAKYTDVLPGSYTLRVRNLSRSNGKTISEISIALTVLQPWWNTWWAWVIYICMVGSLIYFFLRYKSNQLQQKYDEDKIRFFVNTAHDIRTPVTLIMAPLEDLCKEKGLSEDARRFLNLASSNTRKLYDIITQLLDFEKVDSNKRQPVLHPLSLNDILAEEVAGFQPFCDKKQLHLTLSLPPEEVCTMGDRYLIEMLLDNLISNACKYTPPYGEVSITLGCHKRKAVIEVKDNGIGIPQNARKHLFTGVYRADNARESQENGTGFGLLQVQRIVKLLHGKITFRSEENKGSTFTITLSRTNALPERKPKEETNQTFPQPETWEATGDASGDRPEQDNPEAQNTLLIVEDHDALRYYLCKTFEHDYRVVGVPDGQQALAYLGDEYPDLILSDVMMPGIQGDELCKLVKENPETSGIPFILLTAKVNHDAMVEGLKKGADDYIPKPFSTDILKMKVQNLIDNRNRQREYFMRQALNQLREDEVCTEEENLSERDRTFVIQATQLVIDNMDNADFNINTLCQEMAMSRTLFYSRLKSLTGKGPQEFIRIIRLEKAAELLREGKSVTEVAADTGFVNTKYFSSLFKKQFGVQPSKYQQAD